MIVHELELELSSKCNAACPLCPREVPYIKSQLEAVSEEITLSKLKTWLSPDFLQNLKKVIFKGTYSEPTIAVEFLPIVEWFVENTTAQISIHTNGSLRKPEWWGKLGKLLSDRGKVVFGIDGLNDTHAIYRVNTNYEKIIENARSFITNGGYAIWQYIVFKHNEHQIEHAKDYAKKCNFHEFLLIGSERFDKQESTILNIKNQILEKNTNFSKGTMSDIIANGKNSNVKCQSQLLNWIAIVWDGEVFPCCYGISWKKNFNRKELNVDSQKWYKKVLQNESKTNLHNNSIESILQYFNSFYKDLGHKHMLKTCTMYCGVHRLTNNYENTTKTKL